jgi:hypothetical protein
LRSDAKVLTLNRPYVASIGEAVFGLVPAGHPGSSTKCLGGTRDLNGR